MGLTFHLPLLPHHHHDWQSQPWGAATKSTSLQGPFLTRSKSWQLALELGLFSVGQSCCTIHHSEMRASAQGQNGCTTAWTYPKLITAHPLPVSKLSHFIYHVCPPAGLGSTRSTSMASSWWSHKPTLRHRAGLFFISLHSLILSVAMLCLENGYICAATLPSPKCDWTQN